MNKYALTLTQVYFVAHGGTVQGKYESHANPTVI